MGRKDLTARQWPSSGQWQDLVGRQRPHPLGHQPGHQGEWALVKETYHTQWEATSVSRMHGNHKEQHLSHSLHRWKERPTLWHRHAGMSTGSEPYTLRGILSKGAWALMTRLGPSPERGPGTQPHIRPIVVSEFSVHIHYKDEFYHTYVTFYQ